MQPRPALPSLAAVAEDAIARLTTCVYDAPGFVRLHNGSMAAASKFRVDDDACYPRSARNGVLHEEVTMLALKGLYHPQLLKYYEVFPEVCTECGVGVAWCGGVAECGCGVGCVGECSLSRAWQRQTTQLAGS